MPSPHRRPSPSSQAPLRGEVFYSPSATQLTLAVWGELLRSDRAREVGTGRGSSVPGRPSAQTGPATDNPRRLG